MSRVRNRAPLLERLAAAAITRVPFGRYRLANLVARRSIGEFVTSMGPRAGGLLFRCDLADDLAREVYFTGWYGPQETVLLRDMLRPGMTFIDVGANWGYFTLLAMSLTGSGGRIISLEPDPRLFERLTSNIELNAPPHTAVTALAIAASDARGVALLRGYDEDQGNRGLSRMSDHAVDGSSSFSVATDTLDAICEARGIDHVDVMKIDVEGAEGRVLRGMVRLIERRAVSRLFLEMHPALLEGLGDAPEGICAHLNDVGYRSFRVDCRHTTTRRVAYARRVDARSLLAPHDTRMAWDDWPHLLWVAPGVDAMAAGGVPAEDARSGVVR